jgi:Leucine-rich repeat (LRR) protein
MPKYKHILNDLNKEGKLNKDEAVFYNSTMRKYFQDVWETFSLFFDVNLELQWKLTEIDNKKFIDLLPAERRDANEFNFYSKENSSTVCSYCNSADYDKDSLKTPMKLVNKYSTCCPKFGISAESGDLIKKIFKLGDTFVNTYPNLKYFGVRDIKLEFENEKIFFDKLTSLIEVELDSNEIKSIPFSIQNLKDLKSLIIRNNPISSLNDNKSSSNKSIFQSLTNLFTLQLDNLPLLNSASENELISMPSSLNDLVLSRLPLNFLPMNLENCANSLNYFSFTGIPWINFEKYGGYNNSLLTYDNVNNEFGKMFPKETLTKIFHHFDFSNDGFLQKEEINKLNAFIFKKFPRLGDKSSLKTSMHPSGIPNVIFSLVNLKSLNLSYQSIRTIPDEIESLASLNTLILDNCILLESISAKLSGLPITVLDLNNCLSLKTPPPEIVKRGTISIMSYLKRLMAGSVLCKKTKLMLVKYCL